MMRNFSLAVCAAGFTAAWLGGASTAPAAMLKVNGHLVFLDNFENATPVSLAAFPDNSDGGSGSGVYTPNNPSVGSWSSFSTTPAGIQVTNFGTPGAFQGSNYLRTARFIIPPSTVSALPSATADITASTPGDIIHFETMLYVANFTPVSGAAQGTRVFAMLDTAMPRLSLVNIEVFSNGNIFNRFATSGTTVRTDTGLDIVFNEWKKLTVDYVVDSSTWSMTYDGQTVSGLATFTGSTKKLGAISLGGGTANATTNPTGTRIYYDAIPEPATWVLMSVAIVGFASVRRKIQWSA